MQEYFWGASARKTYVYILKSCLEKGQRFEENLWRGIGLLRMNSVEIFWMNNKTIIDQLSYDVKNYADLGHNILLDLYNCLRHGQPH